MKSPVISKAKGWEFEKGSGAIAADRGLAHQSADIAERRAALVH